jgi:hypothetical protein
MAPLRADSLSSTGIRRTFDANQGEDGSSVLRFRGPVFARLLHPAAFFEERRSSMWDAIMIAIGLAFFAVAILYVVACDRL